MKNAVDTMFVLEGDCQGKVQQFPGDYEQYLEFIAKRKASQQAREAAAAAVARQETAAAKSAEPQVSNSSGAQEVWLDTFICSLEVVVTSLGAVDSRALFMQTCAASGRIC